ncbi:MAG: phosphate ABC transporter permease PstA [Chloroflexota bacterium]
MSKKKKSKNKDILYPEGNDLESFVNQRRQRGLLWRIAFQAATVIAIIVLAALLYNIIIGSFGFVSVQNTIDTASLVLTVEEQGMLNAPQSFSSEDDNELADGIVGNPNAIGFFGYAYYLENSDKLRAISVNDIAPTAETAASGEYPYTRPLFIYSTADAIQEKPNVSAYINYYLTNVDTVIEEIGYFPASPEALAVAQQTWLEASELDSSGELPSVDFSALSDEESLIIAGSSTIYPLSRKLAIDFRKAGYSGGINLENIGTSGGFDLFCGGDSDVVNASRAIKRAEVERCEKSRRETPLEFNVGTDALVIVVSTENEFVQTATLEELQAIFTTAETWSEVNPAWPNEPIERFIPGGDSGTLDFFTEETFTRQLSDLTEAELITILENNLSANLVRRYDSEAPLLQRSQEDLYNLVVERVVEPRVIKSWFLTESIFNRSEIEAEVAEIPQAVLENRSWLTPAFLSNPQSSTPDLAGIRTAIFGTLWVIFITVVVAFPLGVGAAIYLEEYAATVSNPWLRRLNAIIQTNINNLAGVPSIIYGMLGLAIFVRAMEPLTSGALFGATDPTTANGRTILSASLTLALLILPLIIINAQEAIRAVPSSLRQAGMGLGATRWQTIWHHVLPNAMPGILTGNILAMSRAIGETAPLVVIGASTFITIDPNGPFSKFTTLPIQIYQWTARPEAEFRNIAAAAIIVLLILLLTLNASAVLLRNRFSRRLA